MRKHYFIILSALVVTVLSACNSGEVRRNPGKIWGPDMTYSRAYDAYTSNPVTQDGLSSQAPVKGTVARGHALPNHLTEADSVAYYKLSSPYKFTIPEMEEGKRLYDIYCGVCHGQKLDGNGPLYDGGNGKFAAMPANLLGPNYINMSSGQMLYAIVYGKNMMGSYSSQLDDYQRWQVVAYIKQIQSENGGAPFTMAAEATVANASTPVAEATTENAK